MDIPHYDSSLIFLLLKPEDVGVRFPMIVVTEDEQGPARFGVLDDLLMDFGHQGAGCV